LSLRPALDDEQRSVTRPAGCSCVGTAVTSVARTRRRSEGGAPARRRDCARRRANTPHCSVRPRPAIPPGRASRRMRRPPCYARNARLPARDAASEPDDLARRSRTRFGVAASNAGGGTRTPDTRIMIPTVATDYRPQIRAIGVENVHCGHGYGHACQVACTRCCRVRPVTPGRSIRQPAKVESDHPEDACTRQGICWGQDPNRDPQTLDAGSMPGPLVAFGGCQL
jgi:hypothetical protein